MNKFQKLFFIFLSALFISLSSLCIFAGEMKVHFIDIGQGDSELVECDGKYMLIDAGDVGKGSDVIFYLKSQNVDKLDYIIATHPHADHIGGMADVINEYGADTFITTSKTATTKCYENMLKAISNKGMKITTPKNGDTYSLGSASFEIITPDDGTDFGDEANNYSVGIKLTYGNTSFVMCGDAEKETEQMIVDSGKNISADVLKCGHHGSSTSTSEAFLDKVNPTYAVISCGKDNKYGHPHKETISKLESRGIEYFRTDELGTIVAVSDGNTVSFPSAGSTGWSQKLDIFTVGIYSESAVRKVISSKGSSSVAETTQVTTHAATTQAATYEETTEATTQTVTTQAITQATAVAPAATSDTQYVLNTNTKKFHRSTCSSVSKMSAKNKAFSNEDRNAIIAKGYSPCQNCNP